MRSGLATLRSTLILALVLSPGLALAKRAAWGKRATVESTSANIDRELQGTSSALRARFGEAVANAVDEVDHVGRSRGGEVVDHEQSGGRGASRQRVATQRDVEGVLVTRSRQVDRTADSVDLSARAERSGPDGTFRVSQRSVTTDGRRRPRTVTIGALDRKHGFDGGIEVSRGQEITKSRWGGTKITSEWSSTTRLGSFASEGNQYEAEESSVTEGGKRSRRETMTVSDAGQRRRQVTTATKRLGGLVTFVSSEGFASDRRGKDRKLGSSRQVVFGGKTLNVGRQRADRAPPARWGARTGPSARVARR